MEEIVIPKLYVPIHKLTRTTFVSRVILIREGKTQAEPYFVELIFVIPDQSSILMDRAQDAQISFM